MALKQPYVRNKYGSAQIGSLKPNKSQMFFLQTFESVMLVALTLSFFAVKMIPSLNENTMLQKYLQFYTAFFVGYETVLKTYNFYTELRDAKSVSKSFYTNPLFLKSIAFLSAFGISILGLLPVNISNEQNSFSLSSLLLATGMATFPYKLVETFFNENMSKKDALFTGLNAVALVVGFLTSFVYEYNTMGTVLGAMLLMQGISMGIDAWQKSKAIVYETVENKYVNMAIYLLQISVVLSILGMYLKQIELGMPQELSFLKKLKTN